MKTINSSQAEKQAAITKWVYDANPELMELKMGCHVIVKAGKNKPYEAKYIRRRATGEHVVVRRVIKILYDCKLEILGSPATLANVLRAIEKTEDGCIYSKTCGCGKVTTPDEPLFFTMSRQLIKLWNLKLPDNLNEQMNNSEELTDLLFILS